MSKTIIITSLITLILVFALSNLAWAKYKCECTSAAPEQIYDVTTKTECDNLCNTYCLSHGGIKKCTEIVENGKNKQNGQVSTAKLDSPIGEISIAIIIGKVIRAFLGIIGTISLVMFIYGGIILLTSAGVSTKIKTGQQTLVWASLGILVVFASYAILKFVFSAFEL